MFFLFKRIYGLCPFALRRRFWFLIAGMLVLAVLETCAVGLIAFYAAAVSDPASSFRFLTNSRRFGSLLSTVFSNVSLTNMIVFLSMAVIAAVLIKNAFSGVITLQIARFSAQLEGSFGCRLLESFLYRDYAWHLNQNSADLIQKVSWRRYVGRDLITPSLRAITEIVILLFLLTALLLVQPVVSLLFIIAQGFLGFLVYRMLRASLDRCAAGCRKSDVEMNRNATLSLHGVKDVKITNIEPYFLGNFSKESILFSKYFGLQEFWKESPLLVLESMGFVLICGSILFMLLVLGYSPLATTGTTALLAVSAWRTLPSFNRIISSLTLVRAAQPYIAPLLADIAFSPTKMLGSDKAPFKFEKQIELKSVSFSYGKNQPILENFSLTIPKGASLGIMGPSGCGKSTLVDLLCGLLRPQEGEILIDGKLLTEENLNAWRKGIGYVPQFPYIYDGTLAENVAFGVNKDQIHKDSIFESCNIAGVDFLNQLPDGIDSFIGERGVRLSGGQRQRVAIARALYRKPKILIFDEATSALDEKMDNHIRQLLMKFKGRMTLVIVSHRSSTVDACDRIIFI
jgi:ABC-type multidrug transport system fused ATPase/permease subunit